eukprot:s102_g31.t1
MNTGAHWAAQSRDTDLRQVASATAFCQLQEPQYLEELGFRNASRSMLHHLEVAGLPIEHAKDAFHTADVYTGTNMMVMLLADSLGDLCTQRMTHWDSFYYVCLQIRSSIRDLMLKMPERLTVRSRSRRLQEAIENVAQMTTQLLSNLASAACMQLPPTSEADPNCRGFLGCHAWHRRLAQGSHDLAVLSHVMQTQLETALLWDSIMFRIDTGYLQLPELPAGVSLGDLRSQDDLRVKTLSTLIARLRASSPRSLRMVEIGVHHGEVAVGLLQRHPSLQYLGIDPYPGEYGNMRVRRGSGDFGDSANFRRTAARLRRFGHRARLCRRHSSQVARAGAMRACQARWPAKHLGLVFIDGAHDFRSVAADIQHWAPRVRPGGVVSGHDYRLGEAFNVVRAVHRFLPANRHLQLGPDGVWWWIA